MVVVVLAVEMVALFRRLREGGVEGKEFLPPRIGSNCRPLQTSSRMTLLLQVHFGERRPVFLTLQALAAVHEPLETLDVTGACPSSAIPSPFVQGMAFIVERREKPLVFTDVKKIGVPVFFQGYLNSLSY